MSRPVRIASIVRSNVQKFISLESSTGVVLAAAAVLANLLVNSGFSDGFESLLSTELGPLSLRHWINDGLMAIFFFNVGMEIKYELIDGALASVQRAALPMAGALGGMAIPALIFTFFNLHSGFSRGWGIPMATDIAFAVGAMSILGSRVPRALKVFLLALAIADDLGAVAVIALFYTGGLQLVSLGLAAAVLFLIFLLAKKNIRWVWLHALLGLAVWILVMRSGVHATVAGCALGFLMPHDDRNPDDPTPLERWIERLHPVAGYFVMPVFALANAGVAFGAISWSDLLTNPLALGIGLGLAIGKPLGIFGAAYGAVRLGLAAFPEGVGAAGLLGAAGLGGIGFTMALFIAGLALPQTGDAMSIAKIGIIAGSLMALIFGSVAILYFGRRRNSSVVADR